MFLIERERERVEKWQTILDAALGPNHPLLDTLKSQIAVHDITDFDDGCVDLIAWSLGDGAKPALACKREA